MSLHIIPNWSDGVRETFEYRTSVFTSESGREQRAARRMTPRRTISFTTILHDKVLRRFKAAMHNRGASTVTIPDPAREAAVLAQDAPVGATEVFLDWRPPWLGTGVQIAVSDLTHSEWKAITAAVSVGAFSSAFDEDFDIAIGSNRTRVTLLTPLTEAWPAGSEIRPIVTGRFPQTVTLQYHTSNTATAQLSLVVQHPATPPLLPEPANGVTHMGREVLLAEPNWMAPPSTDFITPYESVDYGNMVESFLPINFYTKTMQCTFTGNYDEDIARVFGLFKRTLGRRGEFHFPTWVSDFIPAGDIVAGSSSIVVMEGENVAEFNSSTVERHIGILLHTGRWIFRSVTSLQQVSTVAAGAFTRAYSDDFDVAPSSASNYTRINLSAPFGAQNISRRNIAMICWLNVSRFASDTMTIEWYTDRVAKVVTNITSLENLPVET